MTFANDFPTARRTVHNSILCGKEPKQQRSIVENNLIIFYVKPLIPRVVSISLFRGSYVLDIAFRRVLRDLFTIRHSRRQITRCLTIPEAG